MTDEKVNVAGLVGRYGVVHGHTWVSRTIQFFSWATTGALTNYNHTFLVVTPDTVVEALWPTVRFSPLSKYHERALYNVQDDHITAETLAQIAAWGVKQVGIRYNLLGVLAFPLHRVIPLFSRPVAKKADQNHKLFCSELVTRAYAQAGIALFPRLRASVVAPDDLADLIIKRLQEDES